MSQLSESHIPLKYKDGIIYINAQHRRKILDKWVILKEGASHWDLNKSMDEILNCTYFENNDMQYWSEYYRGLKGKYFKRNKYGDSFWIKPISSFFYYLSQNRETTKIIVQICTEKDRKLDDIFDFDERVFIKAKSPTPLKEAQPEI